jgi:hypothetical protein
MELRARTRPNLRRAAMMAALPALLVPAVAGTTLATAAERAPVVKRITPKNVFVGQTLTIHGRYFRRGLNKNTVAFKRRGAKVVFVKAEKGTAKLLKVKLPKRLENVLVIRNGTPVPTRLQIRVLSTKFGKRYTSKRMSPIVGAEKPPAPPKPPVADPDADCDGDGARNAVDTDDDNDLLTDAQEKSLNLDGCHVDSDRDGVEDGYEYRSALDLNEDEHDAVGQSTPYPEKRPYPNALDKTDANTDHDGDSLTLKDEYDLWKYTIRKGAARTLSGLSYSAGEQHSVKNASGHPALAAAGYDKQADFRSWAAGAGYLTVNLAFPGDTIADGTLDGDSLTLKDEYDLWKYTIRKGAARTLSGLSYSAGEQHSVKNASGHPALAAAGYDKQADFRSWAAGAGYLTVNLAFPGDTIADGTLDGDDWWVRSGFDIADFDRDGDPAETAMYYDHNSNGVLDDGERDEDADGLPNQWESTGCLTPELWPALYDEETRYYFTYAGVRLDDEDTDGDGVRDGADDQDHDDVPNVMECSRVLANGAAGVDPSTADPNLFFTRPWKGFVQPFNPCLPHPESRTCRRYVVAGGAIGKWAPFNEDEKYYWIKN